ncbi:hypothetical protein VULLAG_LOCUS13346 [Vulpes lagopus]
MTEEVQGKMNYDDQRSKLEDFNSRYKQCQCPHFACKRIEARTGEVIFPRLLTRSSASEEEEGGGEKEKRRRQLFH